MNFPRILGPHTKGQLISKGLFGVIDWTKKPMIFLTDGIFETGAYGVPSKSQNPTVLGQGGPSSTQCSNPS